MVTSLRAIRATTARGATRCWISAAIEGRGRAEIGRSRGGSLCRACAAFHHPQASAALSRAAGVAAERVALFLTSDERRPGHLASKPAAHPVVVIGGRPLMEAITHSAGMRVAPCVAMSTVILLACVRGPIRRTRRWQTHRSDRPNQSLRRRGDRVMRPAKVGFGVATGGIAHPERFVGQVVAAGAAGWFVLWLLVQSLAG